MPNNCNTQCAGIVDSTGSIAAPITTGISNSSEDILGATMISASLLVVVYMIKYAIDKFKFVSILEAAKELPIDFNTIIITVLVSFYYKAQSVNNLVTYIIFAFGVIVLCSIFRAIISKLQDKDKIDFFWTGAGIGLLIILEYLFPTLLALYVSNHTLN